MPTDAEQLATIKSNYLATLAAISADPKPSYNIDGQSVSWTEYQAMLMDKVKAINDLINDEGPFILNSRGII